MTKLRLVLDTNVLVSGLLIQNSVPQRVYDYAIAHTTLLVSQAVLAEIERVLIRPKFDRYVAELCRDVKDNRLLELAEAGAATHLITGDQDLLVLNPFENVVIQQPVDFLAAFKT